MGREIPEITQECGQRGKRLVLKALLVASRPVSASPSLNANTSNLHLTLQPTVDSTVEQNLAFPGQYFLLESGFSDNWHRFYDPATGRYLQPYPLRFVDGPGVYSYAKNRPSSLVDRTGLLSGMDAALPHLSPSRTSAKELCFEDCEAERMMCVVLR